MAKMLDNLVQDFIAENVKKGEAEAKDVFCPFCDEGDFDLLGLKIHLSYGDCGSYNLLKPNPRRF